MFILNISGIHLCEMVQLYSLNNLVKIEKIKKCIILIND